MDISEIKKLLLKSSYTIVVRKNGETFTSTLRGVDPLLKLLNENPDFLKGAAVADKVIGKGTAMLLAMGKPAYVFANVISDPAIEILEKYRVPFEYYTFVPHIMNRRGTDLCPIEKALLDIDSLDEGYKTILSTTETMKK
ncbi:MAG: DUF1893 domain-containing protein [Ruminiclostridium sp.]